MIPVPIYDELDVSVRIRAVLEREGVCTFEQLCSLNDADLLRFKHLGRASLRELREALEVYRQVSGRTIEAEREYTEAYAKWKAGAAA